VPNRVPQERQDQDGIMTDSAVWSGATELKKNGGELVIA
jgi:hypothetical protein